MLLIAATNQSACSTLPLQSILQKPLHKSCSARNQMVFTEHYLIRLLSAHELILPSPPPLDVINTRVGVCYPRPVGHSTIYGKMLIT